MKKFKCLAFLPLFAMAVAFVGCSSDDDKDTYVVSFEGKLAESESEFESTSTTMDGSYYVDTFTDNDNLLTFNHYFNDWGSGYIFAGFTYSNKTAGTGAPVASGSSAYLAVYASDYTPAKVTINNPLLYEFEGVWVTNAINTYNSMLIGDEYARAFVKGDWLKLTATGYNAAGLSIGSVEMYLANYTSDDSKPLSTWEWFDLSDIDDAVSIIFSMSSTDNSEFGGVSSMNTPAYFCIDRFTLEDK